MYTLTFLGTAYEVDHAVKGVDYIHGYDANGNCVVSLEGLKNFDAITYDGTYMAPTECLEEGCNTVKRIGAGLQTADGTDLFAWTTVHIVPHSRTMHSFAPPAGNKEHHCVITDMALPVPIDTTKYMYEFIAECYGISAHYPDIEEVAAANAGYNKAGQGRGGEGASISLGYYRPARDDYYYKNLNIALINSCGELSVECADGETRYIAAPLSWPAPQRLEFYETLATDAFVQHRNGTIDDEYTTDSSVKNTALLSSDKVYTHIRLTSQLGTSAPYKVLDTYGITLRYRPIARRG